LRIIIIIIIIIIIKVSQINNHDISICVSQHNTI
jgi:hypothetical protein